MVNGNGTETGHIIVTTIGGKNGQPKQVTVGSLDLDYIIPGELVIEYYPFEFFSFFTF